LAAEHVEAGDTSDARLLRPLRQGTSVGGARLRLIEVNCAGNLIPGR
jgi:hypothetical protein